jgi:alpha-D-ribose 1-methylphosphonate 5-triphosphate synthase subunit PhnH
MFVHFRAENRQNFPRGVDLILVAGDAVLCLPRTTVVRVKEA